MVSDIWIDLALSSLSFVNHFAYVYTTFDTKPCSWHAPWHSCPPGGSRTARLGKLGGEMKLWDAACWDGLQDHLGPTFQTGCLSVGTVKPVPRSATGWFSRLCQERWGPLTATRATQESRSPETPVQRRHVRGQAGKSSQLAMVRLRHSWKRHSGRN